VNEWKQLWRKWRTWWRALFGGHSPGTEERDDGETRRPVSPKMAVEVSDQVQTFIDEQGPGPRERLYRALEQLESDRGDARRLYGRFEGYHRMRVGPFRLIFAYNVSPENATGVRCFFAERQKKVYSLMKEELPDEPEEGHRP